jgi:hypothetical protein
VERALRADARRPAIAHRFGGVGVLLRTALRLPLRAVGWTLAIAVVTGLFVASRATPALVTDAAADRSFAAEATASATTAASGQRLGVRAYTRGLADIAAIGQLSEAFDELPVYGPPTLSASPLLPYGANRSPTPIVRVVGGDVDATAIVYAHGDAHESLTPAPGASPAPSEKAAGASLVWLADSTAEKLGVVAGDEIELELIDSPSVASSDTADDAAEEPGATDDETEDAAVPARVAGVYLTNDGLPVSDVVDWPAIAGTLPSDLAVTMRPAALIITDVSTAVDLIRSMDDEPFVVWDVPWVGEVTLEQGRVAAAATRTLDARLHDANSLIGRVTSRAEVAPVTMSTGVGGLVDRAEAAAEELAPLVSSIGLAAQVIAGTVLGALLWLVARGRRVEHAASLRLGMHPVRLGITGAIEQSVPLLVGCGAAYAIVRWAPNAIAGDGEIDTNTIASQASVAIWAIPIVAAIAVVALTVAIWPLEPTSAMAQGRLASVLRWEPVVVVAAIVAGAQLATQEHSALDSGSTLLFPVLALLAGSILVVRALAFASRVLSALRRPRGRVRVRPPRSLALWLARRRLALVLKEVSTIVILVATGAGLFIYSASIARAGEAGLTDKATALGAASAIAGIPTADRVPLGDDAFPAGLPDGWTVVWTLTDARIAPGVVSDLLVIDSLTFADGVSWRETFADRPLAELIAELPGAPAGRVNVIAAGNYTETFPDVGTMSIRGAYINFEVVGRIAAAPGLRERKSMTIIDARSLAPVLPDEDGILPGPRDTTGLDNLFRTQVWSSGDQSDLVAALERPGIDVDLSNLTNVPIEDHRPEFVAFRLSLPYLQTIGLGVLVVALAALWIRGARRRSELAVELAMTEQMGVPVRATVTALVLEALLLGACAVGIGVGIAAALVAFMIGRLDPAPEFAPTFVGQISWPLVAVTAVAIAFVAVMSALAEARAARRMRIVEVLRGAD